MKWPDLLVASALLLAPLAGQGADAEDANILSLARQVIETARYATLVTVDAEGHPRTRIVDPFLPDEHFEVYVATRPVTRKVTQIAGNNRVTLFWWDAEGRNYVSLMGRASLVRDVETLKRMRRPADSDRIYPDFPEDYLLIRIVPSVVEGLLPGYRGDRETWMPARVELNAP